MDYKIHSMLYPPLKSTFLGCVAPNVTDPGVDLCIAFLSPNDCPAKAETEGKDSNVKLRLYFGYS